MHMQQGMCAAVIVAQQASDAKAQHVDPRLPQCPVGSLEPVLCLADRAGYIVGSVEGRAAVVDLKSNSKSFTFKCHRFVAQLANGWLLAAYQAGSSSDWKLEGPPAQQASVLNHHVRLANAEGCCRTRSVALGCGTPH